jgi:hypothetical protein
MAKQDAIAKPRFWHTEVAYRETTMYIQRDYAGETTMYIRRDYDVHTESVHSERQNYCVHTETILCTHTESIQSVH